MTNRKIFYSLITLIVLSLGFSSCGRKVTRISSDEVIDLSGRWNNTDSRLVAEEMINSVLAGAWLTDFMQENSGKRPTVIVGLVYNKSHEHIDAETFVRDMERMFTGTQRVRLVQGGKKREDIRAERADQQIHASASTMKKFGLELGADFMLQGTITSIVDAHKKKKVVHYQVNLELSNLQTNEIVWIGDKKITKLVNR